jgi:hypothetical protein
VESKKKNHPPVYLGQALLNAMGQVWLQPLLSTTNSELVGLVPLVLAE